MKDSKKQYIALFKIGFYLIIILLLIILFICINAAISLFENIFYNWQNSPYFELQKILLSAFVTSVLGIIIKFAFHLDKIKKINSKLYSFLCNKYLISKSPVFCKAIESFICVFYKGSFLPIQKQINLVHIILNEMKNISGGKIDSQLFIVNGDAHSGKTILAQKIINEIFTKEEYTCLLKRYSKSIFYYDFTCFYDQLEEIVSDYENNFFFDKIIVFDNVHKLNINQINYLMKHIIRSPNNAKYILLLTRDVSYALDNELLNEIKEGKKNKLIKINRLPVLKFDDNLGDSNKFTEFLSSIEIGEELIKNDYIKYHLFNIFHIYIQNKDKTVKKLYKQLSNVNSMDPLVRGFAFICCNAVFTGILDEKILKLWLKGKNIHIFLSTYLSIGIITKFHGIKSSCYTIHEKTSKAYIAYICKQQAGLKLCKEYFYYLYEKSENNLKYKYSLPFIELRHGIDFDSIIRNGNFEELYEDINFIIDVFKLDRSEFDRELGLLSDRLGSFLITKECALSLYNQTKEKRHLITLLHADHMMYYDKEYHNTYLDLTNSDDLYLNFASNYWTKHIEMHQGQWDFNSFIRFSEKLPDRLEYISKQSYDNFHVLRRFYFDCLRIYYLQGILNFGCFNELLRRLYFIEKYLSEKLTEFKIYKYKFVYGHIIHYDILFNYKIINKPPTREELQFVGCQNISELLSKAVYYYNKSYMALKKTGDKTSDYILLRLCEISPSFVLKNILNATKNDKDLAEFTTDDYYSIMSIFDDFKERCGIKQNVLEYAAFAETYKLKFTLMCKLNCSNINIDFDRIIDGCISNAIRYHDQYNTKYSNKYGVLRIQIFKTINNYLKYKDNLKMKHDMEKIKNVCLKNNYGRELSLIMRIEKDNYHLSVSNINKIISYYPIVLQ